METQQDLQKGNYFYLKPPVINLLEDKGYIKLGVIILAYNHGTQEVETRGLLRDWKPG